jgi:hypothetical protein
MRRRLAPLVSVCSYYVINSLPKILVGFYSLFSVTEEPFVISGGKKRLCVLLYPSDSIKVTECNFTGRTKPEIKYV